MSGKMDESYFEEKKELSLNSIQASEQLVSEARGLIAAMSYTLPNLMSPAEVHDLLKTAANQLTGVRRDFEKARWASTKTSVEFEAWLRQSGHGDIAL